MSEAALYTRLTGADETPEIAEVRNGLRHVVAQSLNKLADGLIDPKLVLSWLLGAMGAPGVLIGALVPVREAGALLPQLALSRVLARRPGRKRFWATGAALQGVAALSIGAAALSLTGAAGGLAVLAALAVLSVARAGCSLSHKDAVAENVPKTRRGAVTGAGTSLAAAAVFLFGAGLATGILPLTVATIAGAAALAGIAWILAAGVFMTLDETARETSPPEGERLGALFKPLREDAALRRFVAVRACLAVTALAPPFLVMLAGGQGAGGGADAGAQALASLGPLVLASAAASIVTGYLWGRIADRSSRRALMASGGLAALVLGVAAMLGAMTGGLGGIAGAVATMFMAQLAYGGVRQARKLHLTDMTTRETRAGHTALANTVIGVALLAGGLLGLLADFAGPAAALALSSALAVLGAVLAYGLDEVQGRDA
ncbi:MAG: MFS transporter [Pseudomonadota bacterium]